VQLISSLLIVDSYEIQGRAIHFSPLSNSPEYPMIYGESAARANITYLIDARYVRKIYELYMKNLSNKSDAKKHLSFGIGQT